MKNMEKNMEIYLLNLDSDAMMQMNDCASNTPTPSNLEVNKHNKYSYGIVSSAAFIVCVFILIVVVDPGL